MDVLNRYERKIENNITHAKYKDVSGESPKIRLSHALATSHTKRLLKDLRDDKKKIERLIEEKGEEKGLSGLISVFTIISLVAAIFFLSSNITGNAIGSQTISNWIGAVLLVVGLVAGFFWMRTRKK